MSLKVAIRMGLETHFKYVTECFNQTVSGLKSGFSEEVGAGDISLEFMAIYMLY